MVGTGSDVQSRGCSSASCTLNQGCPWSFQVVKRAFASRWLALGPFSGSQGLEAAFSRLETASAKSGLVETFRSYSFRTQHASSLFKLTPAHLSFQPCLAASGWSASTDAPFYTAVCVQAELFFSQLLSTQFFK